MEICIVNLSALLHFLKWKEFYCLLLYCSCCNCDTVTVGVKLSGVHFFIIILYYSSEPEVKEASYAL